MNQEILDLIATKLKSQSKKIADLTVSSTEKSASLKAEFMELNKELTSMLQNAVQAIKVKDGTPGRDGRDYSYDDMKSEAGKILDSYTEKHSVDVSGFKDEITGALESMLSSAQDHQGESSAKLDAAIKAIPVPKAGKDGKPGKDGQGKDGKPGKPGAKGDSVKGKDGKGIEDIITNGNSITIEFTDGTHKVIMLPRRGGNGNTEEVVKMFHLLADIDTTSAVDGDGLIYDETAKKWIGSSAIPGSKLDRPLQLTDQAYPTVLAEYDDTLPGTHGGAFEVIDANNHKLVSAFSYNADTNTAEISSYSSTTSGKVNELVLRPNGNIWAPWSQYSADVARMLVDQDLVPKWYVDKQATNFVKATAIDPDPTIITDPLLVDGHLQLVTEYDHRSINAYDAATDTFKEILAEDTIKQWIASGSLFEGVVAETGHLQGDGVSELSDLAGMMGGGLTVEQMLLKAGHYFTWNGSDGYTITTELGTELVGAVLNTGDWLQLANTGGSTNDPNDPLYDPNNLPEFHMVHIAGDNLTKNRADGLYAFNLWHHAAYEEGSLVTYMGKVYKADVAITQTDVAPNRSGSKWTPLDFSGVTTMTYFGRGGFLFDAPSLHSGNNWGMPANTHPSPSVRHINSDDRYVDLDDGSEVDFTVNDKTHLVTGAHSFGHTREFELVVTADAGTNFTLLDNMPTDDCDLTVLVEDTAASGAVFELRYTASTGKVPLIFPVVINAHNSAIDTFGAVSGTFMGKSLSSLDKTYKIVVQSEDHDLSNITLGTGVTTTTAFIEEVSGTRNYPVNLIGSTAVPNGSGGLAGATVDNIVFVTQAEYDASTQDAKTLYLIERT